MGTLNPHALSVLEFHGWTEADWCRINGQDPAEPWPGDACGCQDDRCIGHHHDAAAECGCLPALIDDVRRDEYLSKVFASIWAVHREAVTLGEAEQRELADSMLAEVMDDYYRAATWYGFVDRGIAYRNQYNSSTWLIFDAERGTRTTEELPLGP